jgi:hypothetical protein
MELELEMIPMHIWCSLTWDEILLLEQNPVFLRDHDFDQWVEVVEKIEERKEQLNVLPCLQSPAWI